MHAFLTLNHIYPFGSSRRANWWIMPSVRWFIHLLVFNNINRLGAVALMLLTLDWPWNVHFGFSGMMNWLSMPSACCIIYSIMLPSLHFACLRSVALLTPGRGWDFHFSSGKMRYVSAHGLIHSIILSSIYCAGPSGFNATDTDRGCTSISAPPERWAMHLHIVSYISLCFIVLIMSVLLALVLLTHWPALMSIWLLWKDELMKYAFRTPVHLFHYIY